MVHGYRRMTRVVAIGECMVEMAPSGAAGSYRMSFAGDTMNTAWYLRRLLPQADQVDYITAIGTDAISDQMIGFLEGAGIGTAHIVRRDNLTVGLYMIQLQDGERSFNYWRGQSAARTLAQDAAALTRALTDATIAYFSGITIAILPEDGRQYLLETLREFRAGGGTVVFDPNLRPRLWETPAQMTSVIMQAASVSDIVLPSHEDEATWFGDTDPEATARRYAASGARMVIVKNGSEQILAWEDGMISRHAPVAVANIIDTTAAGDSFNAGFLAGHLAGQSIAQSIRAAADLAAKVIQSRGALVSGIL